MDKTKQKKSLVSAIVKPRPLRKREYEKMNWKGNLQYPGMIRIRTDLDGNCFFHALAKSYFKPYITGKTKEGNPLNRKKFIKNLRRDLAKMLNKKVDPTDSDSLTWYESMANGEWTEEGKKIPELTLKYMQKELDSNASISHIYNEFISDQLDKDIYILDIEKKDVYMTGTDDALLYKDRPSIIILYLPGHYELVGVKDGEDYIQTIFEPDSDIIKTIRKRMTEIKLE